MTRLDSVLAASDGILLARDLERHGLGHDVVKPLIAAGALVRIHRGVYVSAARLSPDDGVARTAIQSAKVAHLARLDALLKNFGRGVAASHHSACLLLDLPVPSTLLTKVALVRTAPGGTSRSSAGFSIYLLPMADAVVARGGRQVVIAPLAVVGVAMQVELMDGAAVVDDALRRHLVTNESLENVMGQLRRHSGIRAARAAVRAADGLAESPGETRLRLILDALGIRYIAQFWLLANGRFYRVDFYLPDLGVVLEFDGRAKYQGDGTATSVIDEKDRENDIRGEGFGVARILWNQLRPTAVRAAILRVVDQALPQAKNRQPDVPAWAEDRR